MGRDGRVIYTAGVWDLFHLGHLMLLEGAKALGDFLVVGVVSDEGAAEYKGRRPVVPQGERLAIIRGLRCVDGAMLQLTTDPSDNIRDVRPAIFVHGSDWKRLLRGHETLEELGIQYVTLPYTNGVSSTQRREDTAAATEASWESVSSS